MESIAAPGGGPAAAAAAEAEEKRMRVMVAIDDSDESFYALQWVLDNFVRDGDESMLTIIHVMEPFPHYVFPGVHAVFPTTSIIQSVNKAQQENASAILACALRMCTQKMIKAKSIVLEGDPKETICHAADQMDVDLIVIGSRGLGKIRSAGDLQHGGTVSDTAVAVFDAAMMISDAFLILVRPFTRAFIGSVSDYVAHHATCPVLIVKPPTSKTKT